MIILYTIFKYGGTNGYGGVDTDEAIFKGSEYIMDYADELDEDDPDYSEKMLVKMDLLSWKLLGNGDSLGNHRN